MSADDKTYGLFLWQHLGDVVQLTWLHTVLKLIYNWLINVKLLFVLGFYTSHPIKERKKTKKDKSVSDLVITSQFRLLSSDLNLHTNASEQH